MNTPSDNDAPLPPQRCRCGGDLPGRCPGPSACPLESPGPECRVCNHATSHRQDADDTWICADCEDIEA